MAGKGKPAKDHGCAFKCLMPERVLSLVCILWGSLSHIDSQVKIRLIVRITDETIYSF